MAHQDRVRRSCGVRGGFWVLNPKATAQNVTRRGFGASCSQLCPAGELKPGSPRAARADKASQRSVLPRNASFHLSGSSPHGSGVIWGSPACAGKPWARAKTRRRGTKRPPPARHPANPTLPRILRAEPWLPMREGIEPGPGFLVPASSTGKQQPVGTGRPPGPAPCHLAAGPHRCCPGSASQQAPSRDLEAFWGWEGAVGPSGGWKDEGLVCYKGGQSCSAGGDRIMGSLSINRICHPLLQSLERNAFLFALPYIQRDPQRPKSCCFVLQVPLKPFLSHIYTQIHP